MEEQESDPGQIEYINRLIEQLDEKISSLGAQRTDPDAIASSLANQLSGYFSVLVNNFLSKKEEEEVEAAKPRKIMEEPTPIDIVSVSPQAAGQIASALEAAGIGKYKLNITQVNTKSDEEESSGLLDGLMGALATVVSFLSGLLTGFLTMMGPFLLSAFSAMVRYIAASTFSVKGLLRKVFSRQGLKIIGGATAIGITTLLASDSIPVFDKALGQFADLKKRADEDPYSLMNYMESANDVSAGEFDLTKAVGEIDEFEVQGDNLSDEDKAKAQTGLWFENTLMGKNYARDLLKSPDYKTGDGQVAFKAYEQAEEQAHSLDEKIEQLYHNLEGEELEEKKKEIYSALAADDQEAAFKEIAEKEETAFKDMTIGDRAFLDVSNEELSEAAAFFSGDDFDSAETIEDSEGRGKALLKSFVPSGGMSDIFKRSLERSSESFDFQPASESLYNMEEVDEQYQLLPGESQSQFDDLLEKVVESNTDRTTSTLPVPSPRLGPGNQFDDISPVDQGSPTGVDDNKLMLALQHASDRDLEHTKELEAVRNSLLGISRDSGESSDTEVPEEDDLNFGVEQLRTAFV